MSVTLNGKYKDFKLNNSILLSGIHKFLEWKNKNGYTSYDQYDFWNTKYGRWSKNQYHHHRVLGSLLVAPVFVADIFIPEIRERFNTKKRFSIADSHLIMACLNLYKYTSDKEYLLEAENIASELIKSSIPGYSGYCWGYPFDWMTKRGLWTKDIPLITATGYCFEAYIMLYDITGKEEYYKIAHSIFLFTLKDLKDIKLAEGVSVSSYSPMDDSQVFNANAYRAFVLTEGSLRFNNAEALVKARLNINFIVANQNQDGSWFYAKNNKSDKFIDNFHTCFVLKNLIKINSVLKDEKVEKAIKNGFNYYKTNLLTKDHIPIPFAKLSRFNTVKVELYDYAEGISLCLMMKGRDKSAGRIAEEMTNTLIKKFQKKDGSFVTRVNILGIQNKIPYLRWPQAQLFYALTNYLRVER